MNPYEKLTRKVSEQIKGDLAADSKDNKSYRCCRAQNPRIGLKDGFRALYCILAIAAQEPPVIGGCAAVINLIIFRIMLFSGLSLTISTLSAFIIAAAANYLLCILILFRHKARWNSWIEILIYIFIVAEVALIDLGITKSLFKFGASPLRSKTVASALVLILNFSGRRYFVFPEPTSRPWRSQAIGLLDE
jgi:putative flippase GtrA